MTKIDAIKQIILNNGGIADWEKIYDQIEEYYPNAKKTKAWKEGIRGVLYRDEEIIKLETGVFKIKNKRKSWIIPCNPKFYDIDSAFDELKEIEWTQKKNLNMMRVGDMVYIYLANPFGRISFQCEVTAAELTVPTIDDTNFIYKKEYFSQSNRFFRIKMQRKISSSKLSLLNLQKNGVNGYIQNGRIVSGKPLEYIENCFLNSQRQITTSIETKKVILEVSEENLESYFNMADTKSCYNEQHRLVKLREVNQKIVSNLKKLYGGQCQLCGECVGNKFGVNIVQGHHIEYFCKTQNNDSDNILIVCPNCHSLIHKLNAVFNRENESFDFNGNITKLKINEHL